MACGKIAHHFPSACVGDSLHFEHNLADVFLRVTLVEQIRLPVVDVFFQRAVAMLLERIGDAGHLAFYLAGELIKHRLSGRLVRGQRNSLFTAVGRAKASPPFLRLRLHPFAGFTVGDRHGFLVQTRH
ncbi:MAG: hypothetical protein R3C10_27690 [Pirellulales bacterium]